MITHQGIAVDSFTVLQEECAMTYAAHPDQVEFESATKPAA